MEAMTTNACSDFQESIVRQQVTCARLVELEALYPVLSVNAGADACVLVDPDLAARISAATLNLKMVSRYYSTLLTHFSETARIFAGMFRGYGGPEGNTFCFQKVTSTWSCEL
jgi:hypothetical protein